MNAIDFLVTEHKKVRKLCLDLADSSDEKTKKSLFHTISHELVRHELMEQKIWYPKLETHPELDKIIQHLLSEEKKAKSLLKEIKKTQDLDEWEKKVSELIKEVKHHADEEEKNLFPKVGKYVSSDFLMEIGNEMRVFKQKAEKPAKAA